MMTSSTTFRRASNNYNIFLLLLSLLLSLHFTPSLSFGEIEEIPAPMIDDNFGEGGNQFHLSNQISFNDPQNQPAGIRLVPVGRPLNFKFDNDDSVVRNDPFVHQQNLPISGLIQALLGDNRGDPGPPQIARSSFDPFQAWTNPRAPPSMFNNKRYQDRIVYPFPEDCEDELHGQCLGMVRVCSDDGCTLECERTGGPPTISSKCQREHPCAEDLERLCKVMGDEKRLFKCLVRHKNNVSAACKRSEPCIQEDNHDCNLKGVGRHIFGRADGKYGEKHLENDACSCKKHFGGFKGCGAHMTHPFCLPCGPNCVRNPACGSGALWCEVQDNDRCKTDGTVKTFGYKLNQLDGNDKYKNKFPKTMLEQKYRQCKPAKHLGLGSWLKDIMEPMATRIEDDVEDIFERQKSRTKLNQTFHSDKSDKSSKTLLLKDKVASSTASSSTASSSTASSSTASSSTASSSASNKNKNLMVTPDIVPETDLFKIQGASSMNNDKQKKITQNSQHNTVVVDNTKVSNAGDQIAATQTAANVAKAATAATTANRGNFMKYLWMGIGIVLIATIIVSFRGKNRRESWSRHRTRSNERVSKEVGDEFL